MPPDQEHLIVILSVALGQVPFKDLAPLADRSNDTRKALQGELATHLGRAVMATFQIERLPYRPGGPPMSGRSTAIPVDLVGVDMSGWRGKR